MKVKKLLDIAAGKKLPMLACNEYLAKVGFSSASCSRAKWTRTCPAAE